MTERLNTVSNDQYIQTSEIEDNKNKINLNWKGKSALIGTGALFATGIIMGGANILHETPVGNPDIESVPAGSNAIDTIRSSVNEIAEEHGFDPNSVHGIVQEGQEIGSHVEPGQELESTVSIDGLGHYSVDTKIVNPASPDNLAHLAD